MYNINVIAYLVNLILAGVLLVIVSSLIHAHVLDWLLALSLLACGQRWWRCLRQTLLLIYNGVNSGGS